MQNSRTDAHPLLLRAPQKQRVVLRHRPPSIRSPWALVQKNGQQETEPEEHGVHSDAESTAYAEVLLRQGELKRSFLEYFIRLDNSKAALSFERSGCP